jgi:hypothetical protein
MTAVSAPWPPRTYITQPFALSINPEEGKIPTVDTCPAGSKTRRKASRRQAVQRAAGNSESHSSPAGSTMALGTDCVARSTWVCCHAEMSINQSINQSQWFSVHVSRKDSTLTSRCPAAVVCSSTLHRATCVLGPSSPYGAPLFPAEAARVHAQISIAAHFFPQH